MLLALLVVSFVITFWATKAETADDWRTLGTVNGCEVWQRNVCYLMVCDNGQADLSCR